MVKVKNELIAECCVCGQHVAFTDGDRNNLLKHSEEAHGTERVVRYDILKPRTKSKAAKSDTSVGSKTTPKYDGDQDFHFGHAVVCASCGHIGPPILRRQSRFKKPFFMITSCCPILAMACFLSCCTPRVAYVYCGRCSKHLGTYNTRNGKYTMEGKKETEEEPAEEKKEIQSKSNAKASKSRSKTKN